METHGDDQELRRVQLVQLDMLCEYDRICRAHGLTYYLIGGTLLGAVRHRGFIPWDDDIDVGMPREDYDRFIRVAALELTAPYQLQLPETDSCSPFMYLKLRNSDTTFIEATTADRNMNHGIFIDVFPLDNVPDGAAQEQRLLRQMVILYFLQLGKVRLDAFYRGMVSVLAYSMIRLASALISTRWLFKLYHTTASRYRNVDTQRIANLCAQTRNLKREVMPREWFSGHCLVEFEGKQFPAPPQWHEYLTQLYHDYMQLPPVEKRLSHSAIVTNTRRSYLDYPCG